MKILNLHFKNINSLEGENRIDFTQAPFSDAGVFAITGANGSGKSSILDAITLALYGETFRFNKPAAHVMTKHTADSFAMIEFSLGSEKYQSAWHVERVGGVETGELKPAEMLLMDLNNNKILASTPSQVCQKMTDITGMNFRNFTRAALLAQGEWAAFLNALDNERIDILEKMMSSDIYTDYKQSITSKAQQAQALIDSTKNQLNAIDSLPPEKIEAYQLDLADFKARYAEVATENKTLTAQQAAIKNIAAMQAQVNTQKKNLKQAKQDAQALEQQLNDAKAYQHLAIYQNDVQALQQQEQSIKQQQAELVSLQGELISLKAQVGNPISHNGKTYTEQQHVIGELKKQIGQINATAQSEISLINSLDSQIAERQTALAEVRLWLDQRPADATLLERFPDIAQLTRLRAELLDLTTQHKHLNRQTKEAMAALNDNTSALEKEQARFAADTGQLAQDEQDLSALQAQYSLERLTELRQDQQERVKGFQELNDIAVVYQRLSKTGGGLFSWFSGKKTKQDEIDIVELEHQYEELKLEVEREENIKTVLEQAVQHEELLKKLAQHREHLIDGKPCPLCGALEHPYSKKEPIIRSSQHALNNQIARIKNLLGRTYDVGRQLETLKHKIENDNSKWARRQRLSSQWFILANRLNTHRPDLSIDNLELMLQLLKAEQEELKSITELALRYREKQQSIVRLKANIEKSNATIERLKTAVDGFTADSEVRSQQHLEFEQKLRDCQQAEQQAAEQVIGQLTALGEKIPSKNKENQLFARLTQRKQDYQNQLLQAQAIENDMALLNEKRIASENAVRAYKPQLDTLNTQLQTEEKILVQLSVIEKQGLLTEKERAIAEQQNALQQKQQTLLASLQPAINSLTDLNNKLNILQSQAKLEQQLAKANADIAAKIQSMEKTSTDLDVAFQLSENQIDADKLNQELKRTGEQMEIANLEIRRLERVLDEQKTLQAKQSRLKAQLKQQELDAVPMFAELEGLNADNGMIFRRKVQQQLIDKLLGRSNALLEKISGRYYIRQQPSEQGLALVIEDTAQANVQRLPKTLSGGETFVISLALALGLAEMASNGRSVDSLFIDEGFGNLDAETLYVIISTLENLQTQGKTVGVISHVDAIQQRFKAQLQVVKKPNGMGMLKQAS